METSRILIVSLLITAIVIGLNQPLVPHATGWWEEKSTTKTSTLTSVYQDTMGTIYRSRTQLVTHTTTRTYTTTEMSTWTLTTKELTTILVFYPEEEKYIIETTTVVFVKELTSTVTRTFTLASTSTSMSTITYSTEYLVGILTGTFTLTTIMKGETNFWTVNLPVEWVACGAAAVVALAVSIILVRSRRRSHIAQ